MFCFEAENPVRPYIYLVFTLSSKDVSVTTCCHIMGVIGDIAPHLNEDTTSRIVGE